MAQLWIFTQVHYRHHCVYIQASQSLLKLQASLWKSHRTPQGVLLTLSLGCDNNCKATAPSFEESDQLNNKSNIVQFTFGAPEHCVCVRKRERGRSLFVPQMAHISLSLSGCDGVGVAEPGTECILCQIPSILLSIVWAMKLSLCFEVLCLCLSWIIIKAYLYSTYASANVQYRHRPETFSSCSPTYSRNNNSPN